jgi:hypothetical protein
MTYNAEIETKVPDGFGSDFCQKHQPNDITTGKGRSMKSKSATVKNIAVWALGLFAVAAASFISSRLVRPNPVLADNDRIFELRIYHAVPGKLSTMESRFRDKTSKILARHNLNVVGYWVTEDPQDNSFVFLLAHQSREEANKNWQAFRLDPDFQEVAKSEQTEKTLEKADILWLHPTDFSPMK